MLPVFTCKPLARNSDEGTGTIRTQREGFGYFTMRDKVNAYIDATGANKAIDNDQEAIRYGREAAALAINIDAIHLLNKAEEQKLNEALISIADDLPQTRSRGFRR